MRKILISILIVLLVILAYFTIFQGITLGNLKILSAGGIIDLNDALNLQIENLNRKIKVDLNAKEAELMVALNGQEGNNDTGLLQAKEKYYDLVNVSTDSQITASRTQESYTTEYLYLRIGRHVREEGVNINLNIVTTGSGEEAISTLEFTVTGPYYAIINFVSALEDDSELSFRIDNFNLLPSDTELEATFDVSGIRVQQEDVETSVESESEANTQTNASSQQNIITENTNTVQ